MRRLATRPVKWKQIGLYHHLNCFSYSYYRSKPLISYLWKTPHYLPRPFSLSQSLSKYHVLKLRLYSRSSDLFTSKTYSPTRRCSVTYRRCFTESFIANTAIVLSSQHWAFSALMAARKKANILTEDMFRNIVHSYAFSSAVYNKIPTITLGTRVTKFLNFAV